VGRCHRPDETRHFERITKTTRQTRAPSTCDPVGQAAKADVFDDLGRYGQHAVSRMLLIDLRQAPKGWPAVAGICPDMVAVCLSLRL
jgi:hypothetical protein